MLPNQSKRAFMFGQLLPSRFPVESEPVVRVDPTGNTQACLYEARGLFLV